MMMLMCAIGDLFMSPFRISKKVKSINANDFFFHNEVATVFKELVEQYEINRFFTPRNRE
jgi:hypothetical protein